MTGWNKLCLVYLTKVAEPGTPPLPTAGFFSLRLMPRYFVRQQGITDDRMMAAPLAPMMGAQTGLKSRKLRFRMIDDIQHRAVHASKRIGQDSGDLRDLYTAPA